MPKKQRLLKLCILLFTPIATLAAMGTLAGTIWFGLSGERYLGVVNAPSGRFRAIIVHERDSRDCGQSGSTYVTVERRIWLVKTGTFTPFCVSNDSVNGLSLHWSGNDDLSITCPKCRDENFWFYDGNWGAVSFRLTTAAGN
jgi:hypothetical protein